ncbi:hypothetical protein AB1N83_013970 [Pleurotus pulmonarius]
MPTLPIAPRGFDTTTRAPQRVSTYPRTLHLLLVIIPNVRSQSSFPSRAVLPDQTAARELEMFTNTPIRNGENSSVGLTYQYSLVVDVVASPGTNSLAIAVFSRNTAAIKRDPFPLRPCPKRVPFYDEAVRWLCTRLRWEHDGGVMEAGNTRIAAGEARGSVVVDGVEGWWRGCRECRGWTCASR